MRNLDWAKVGDSLQEANGYYIAAGVLVICLGYVLRAKRWQVLLEPITKSSFKDLFATTTVGFAAIFLVGRAGEIVRPMWLPMRDRRVRPSAALVTLGVERIFDLASLICFFAVNLLWFKPPPGREKDFEYVQVVGYLLLLGTVVGFVCLYIYQKFAPKIIAFTAKLINKRFIPKKIQSIILSLLRQLEAALGILKDWREIVSVVFWTVMLWLSIALPTWFVMQAFNLEKGIIDALFVMGFAAVGSLIPTPGGAAGAFHAATANGLIFLNIPDEKAYAVSFVMHLVYFAPAIIFGLYYLLHGDISFSRFKSLLDSEHAVEEIEHDTESKVQSPKSKDELQTSS